MEKEGHGSNSMLANERRRVSILRNDCGSRVKRMRAKVKVKEKSEGRMWDHPLRLGLFEEDERFVTREPNHTPVCWGSLVVETPLPFCALLRLRSNKLMF